MGISARSFGLVTALGALALAGCTGVPDGVDPVSDFALDRYLGDWYEIARLDHSFEEGLTRVTATYRARDDGGVNVINRGYSEEEQEWQEAEGKGYFQDDPNTGLLKVSFFGPFYSTYLIFELDEEYQHAFVTGHNKDYLWLLARTPKVSPALREKFLKSVQQLGYHTQDLVWVQHEPLQE